MSSRRRAWAVRIAVWLLAALVLVALIIGISVLT
jgi:hypothetical protein